MTSKITERLSRLYIYQGPAWYQRQVEIPDGWKDKRIILFLERTKQTTVWVDSQSFGSQKSLCAPHTYDVTDAMRPGNHILTIQVNNEPNLFPVGRSHAFIEETQTNWNGIIGQLELIATDKIWLDDIQVYPDINKSKVKIRLTIGNVTGKAATGRITLEAKSCNTEKAHQLKAMTIDFKSKKDSQVVEAEYSFGKNSFLWDEFSPVLYNLKVQT